MLTKSMYRIFALPLFQDNYSYIIQGTKQKQLVLVDPANPSIVLNFIKNYLPKFNVSNILYTHKHWDHAGGNQQIYNQLMKQNSQKKLNVFIGENDKGEVPAANRYLKGGEMLEIGDSKVKVYFVPCHTKGHIVYHFLPKQSINNNQIVQQIKQSLLQVSQGKRAQIFETSQCVFTGDTLFSAGIGRFFQGNAEQMVQNIQLLTDNIKDNVDIFNGHQYALQNITWAINLHDYYEKLQKLVDLKGDQNICTLPTNFGRQKQINLFVRSVTGTYLHQKVTTDKIELMNLLREMKNKNLTQFPQNM